MHKRVIQVYRISSPNRYKVKKKVYPLPLYHRKGVGDEVDKLKAYFKPTRYNRDCIINEPRLNKNFPLETR